jgi:hypothetical protein
MKREEWSEELSAKGYLRLPETPSEGIWLYQHFDFGIPATRTFINGNGVVCDQKFPNSLSHESIARHVGVMEFIEN